MEGTMSEQPRKHVLSLHGILPQTAFVERPSSILLSDEDTVGEKHPTLHSYEDRHAIIRLPL